MSDSFSLFSSNICSNVSRRRLAFRPQSVKASLKKNRFPSNIDDSIQPSTSISYDSSFLLMNTSNVLQIDQQAKNDEITVKLNGLISTDLNNQTSQESQQQSTQKSKRRLVTNWSFQEMTVFYDALKQHGKNFEMITRHMARKKLTKDRDQVRNYYFNAFKIWKMKAQLEERDWSLVPRDARELFVVLNGCEWRKKTGGASFDSVKFKNLIIEGTTSVRIKKKKSLVTIRTPHCPCLLKFFPHNKRNSVIPTHVSLKLTPFRYVDRNFVISCEQNPLVHLRININDKILNIFNFFKKKWIRPLKKMANFVEMPFENEVSNFSMRLRVNDNVQIHKVEIEMNSDHFSLMSLRKLRRNYESTADNMQSNLSHSYNTLFSADENSNESQKNFLIAKNKLIKDSNKIKLDGSYIKEVFDLDEYKLKNGVTIDNVENASVLQLYYLCGMMNEITLSYEICEPPTDCSLLWRHFISLVNRDYGELVAKTITNQQQKTVTSNNRVENNNEIGGDLGPLLSDTNILDNHDTEIPLVKHQSSTITAEKKLKKQRNKSLMSDDTFSQMQSLKNDIINQTKMVANNKSNVVEEENAQFLQQLLELQQSQTNKRPKRQVKVIPNPKKIVNTSAFNYSKSINQNRTPIQNPQLNSLEYTKYNKNQRLIHHQQQQPVQNICLVETSDTNSLHLTDNNNFSVHNNVPIQNSQPFTYVITPDVDAIYNTNNKEVVRREQSKTTSFNLSQHSNFIDVQQQQNHPQLSSIVYQTQNLVNDSQPVVAFLQNNDNSFSIVPIVTAVEINNCPQYTNLTKSSVENIPQKTTTMLCAPISSKQVVTDTNSTTIYLPYDPPPPTDFSHFTSTSNLELQSLVSVSEENQKSSFLLQPLSTNSVSASFLSPTKAGYNRRHAHYKSSLENNQQNILRNDMNDSELANVNDFSLDSFSSFVNYSSNNGQSQSNSGVRSQQISNNSILLLDSSPSKTLPEDVRNAYEQMLKENSIDYCRNFEQLTQNIEYIHKNIGRNSQEESPMSLDLDDNSIISSKNIQKNK